MRNINPILLEAKQEARAAKAKEMQERAKNWKRNKRLGVGNFIPNTYQLFTSGRPTGELKEMIHLEAVMINRATKDAFRAKVIEAIDAGGRYEGALSEWRIYEHHLDRGRLNITPEERRAKARANHALRDALKGARHYKKSRKSTKAEPSNPTQSHP